MVERRRDDPRIVELMDDVAVLKSQMTENTRLTKEVREILASFRIAGKVAKWVTAMGAAGTMLYHGALAAKNWLK